MYGYRCSRRRAASCGSLVRSGSLRACAGAAALPRRQAAATWPALLPLPPALQFYGACLEPGSLMIVTELMKGEQGAACTGIHRPVPRETAHYGMCAHTAPREGPLLRCLQPTRPQ